MSLYNVLIKPIFTEKASKQELVNNCYAFQVDKKATKVDVKKAIFSIYGLEVKSVNIMNTRSKTKYGRKGIQNKRRETKKALIVLKDPKAKIDYTKVKK